MPRNLRQYMKIDRNVLEKKEIDHVVKNVNSEKEFNEICRQNPEIENINFHIESKSFFLAQIQADQDQRGTMFVRCGTVLKTRNPKRKMLFFEKFHF
jgi:hypothetical protein